MTGPGVRAFSVFGEITTPGLPAAIRDIAAFNAAGKAAAGSLLPISTGALAAAGAVGVLAGAIGIVGTASVSQFANFDEAMTKSLAIMGDVSTAMRTDMVDAAREVGRATQFSATQAAEAYFFLASAGLNAAQSIKAMPTVAQFAQAGQFDLARATDLLTDAQSALGLTIRDDVVKNMENMARVSDVLVKANTLANATVEQFSESLTNRAGAALKLVNKDIEEGVAVLAAMADQGVKGAESGTRLDIVLRDLQTRAIKNADAFQSLNIQVFDSERNMRNIADIIGDIERALKGMSDEQSRATIMQLGFSDRSVASLLTLIGLSKEIRRYETELRKAKGITQEVAEKQMATFRRQVGLLKSEVADLAIVIGSRLTPVIERELIQPTRSWIQEMREFFGVIDRIKREIQTLPATLKRVGSPFALAGQRPPAEVETPQEIGDVGPPLDVFLDILRDRQRAREAIELEDLRVLVQIGQEKREVLLERLRIELDAVKNNHERRRELLLEIHRLEQDIEGDRKKAVDEHNRRVQDSIDEQRDAFVDAARERRQIEQETVAFLIETGQMTRQERLRQIQQELQDVQLGQLERLRLLREQVVLMREIAKTTVDWETIGREAGESLIQGMVFSLLQGGAFLRNALLTIASRFIVSTITNAVFPGAGTAAASVSSVVGATPEGLLSPSVVAPSQLIVDFRALPPARSIEAQARDADHVRLWIETAENARARGYGRVQVLAP